MTTRVIEVKLLVSAPGATKAANETADGLDKVAKKTKETEASTQGAKDALISFGTVLKTAVVVGAGLAVKSMLDLGMSYEKTLNTLQAVSGASAATMTEVSTAAKALGNDIALPGASAADAAQAMTELAKGGLTVEQAMSAAKGTLQLAAAAQIDGAQAAEIQSAALNTFQLAASDAGRVADVLANAANASSGEITDFAQGMAQSGLAAQAMGISLEDTATVLGLFANNGLSGSDAGTSFKTMLISLTNPSEKAAGALKELGVVAFDANGQFVGMRAITEQLTAAQQRMTTEQFNQAAATAFGTDALRAAVAVAAEGTDGFDAMSSAIGKQGGAADVAAANSVGLAGAVDLVKNAAETAALGLYEQLSPALDEATRGVADMVPTIATSLLPALTEAGTALIGLVDIVAPLIPLVGDALASAVSAAAATITALAPVVEVSVEALAGILGVVSDLPGPILAAATAFAVLTLTAPFGAMVTAIGAVVASARVAGGALAALKAAAMGAFSNPVILAAAAVAAAIGLLVFANEDAEVAVSGATGAIDEQTGALKANSTEILAKAKAQDGSLAKLKAVGVDGGLFVKALQGDAAAIAEVEAKLRTAADAAEDLNNNRPDFGLNGEAFQRDYVEEATAAMTAYQMGMAGIATETEAVNAANAAMAMPEWSDDKAAAYGRSVDAINRARDELDGKPPVSNPVEPATVTSLEAMATKLDGVKNSASEAETRIAFLTLELDRLAGRAPDVEAAARAAQGAIRDSVSAYLGQGAATREVTQAQIDLSAAQNKGVDDNYSLEQKTLDVANAQDRLILAQNGVAAAADASAAANRGVFEAFVQQSQQAFDTAKANGNLAGAQEAARAKGQALRDSFIDLQVAGGMSREEADRLATSIGLLPEDTALQITMNGAPQALSDADKLKAKLAEINGSTATAYVKIVQSISAIGSSAASTVANSILGNRADGGITLTGGVTVMADGGLTRAASGLSRQAMIAPGGSNILWAEDETQGESYIPHAPAKRARSNEIMATTAEILGGAYFSAQQMAMSGQQAGGYTAAAAGGGAATYSPNIEVYVAGKLVTDLVQVVVDRTPLSANKLVSAQREVDRTSVW